MLNRVAVVLMAAFLLGGCTSAGPYVTSISSDGSNGLVVEKCTAYMNGFTGTISNGECTSHNIKLKSQP